MHGAGPEHLAARGKTKNAVSPAATSSSSAAYLAETGAWQAAAGGHTVEEEVVADKHRGSAAPLSCLEPAALRQLPHSSLWLGWP